MLHIQRSETGKHETKQSVEHSYSREINNHHAK